MSMSVLTTADGQVCVFLSLLLTEGKRWRETMKGVERERPERERGSRKKEMMGGKKEKNKGNKRWVEKRTSRHRKRQSEVANNKY